VCNDSFFPRRTGDEKDKIKPIRAIETCFKIKYPVNSSRSDPYCGAMPKASIVKDGVEFKVGDQVLLRQGGAEDLPYVARIDKIGNKDRKSSYELYVTWFYRPEDVGRRVSLLQNCDSNSSLFFLVASIAMHPGYFYSCLTRDCNCLKPHRPGPPNVFVLSTFCSNITANGNYSSLITKTLSTLLASSLNAQSGP
jgi:hypothetical protein